ncbi:MAG: hypothetical protein A2520_09535 [Deltaproteobacteria bacterium RIFOXYD12_FULL_53_23]|nr:MAG: hypothetical protein A2520_09535 [Deltaproteobacteria bacterium RIFOXYD12_FULL_53_23]
MILWRASFLDVAPDNRFLLPETLAEGKVGTVIIKWRAGCGRSATVRFGGRAEQTNILFLPL